MNGMTFGHFVVSVGCGVAAAALLIVFIALFCHWSGKFLDWARGRKMKTYMVRFNANRTYGDKVVRFCSDADEVKYYRARSPHAAVAKLFAEPRFSLNAAGDVCVRKVAEIRPG